MKEQINIFTWLDEVRERPSMYARSLQCLESQIIGYYWALSNYNIIELVPNMDHHFNTWVYYRMDWSTASGWADAIQRHTSSKEEQFERFFALVDEYRQLKPVLLRTARLLKHNQPTGKRVVDGLGGRMEKPKRIDIIRYMPKPLHFFRFHYPDRIEDGWLLMKHDGTYDTTLQFAKKWVRDEFEVKRDQWKNKR